jgi:hypothetical protein
MVASAQYSVFWRVLNIIYVGIWLNNNFCFHAKISAFSNFLPKKWVTKFCPSTFQNVGGMPTYIIFKTLQNTEY